MTAQKKATQKKNATPPHDSAPASEGSSSSKSQAVAARPQGSTKRSRKKLLSDILYVTLFMLWVFISLVIGQVFVGTILYSILGEDLYQNNLWTTVYTALSYALSCFLVIYLPGKFKKLDLKTSREELGLSGWPKWRDIALAIAGFIVYLFLATILVSIISTLFSWFDATEAQPLGYSDLYDTTSRILAFIGLIVIAPIAEEVIFRGWLYGKLRRHASIWVSALLVSLLFGFAHAPLSVAVNVFVMSVIMCLMRELTGTIHASIILHILKNAIAVGLLIYSGML